MSNIHNYSYIDTPDSRRYVLEQLSRNTKLSDWEKSFIENVKEYHSGGGFLSGRQKQKLSDLWEKY